MIELRGLTKIYRVAQKKAGLRASVASLFSREYVDVEAVVDLSFTIPPGECVGFLGPNGAGKTTTLKMLSGLLSPSHGSVQVLGFDPSARKREFLKQITLVMGQKQQLLWDLPPIETLELNRAVYELARAEFDAALAELDRMLGLKGLLEKPTRQLSLGERMKCELAAALIHRPRVLFLDEPTIGLDVNIKAQVRRFIAEYNLRTGATVLLTSHDMDDVNALCRRVIVIDKGRVRYDGDLKKLVEETSPDKLISVRTERAPTEGERAQLGRVLNLPVSFDGPESLSVKSPSDRLTKAVAALLETLPVVDLRVEDPPLEETMQKVFGQE